MHMILTYNKKVACNNKIVSSVDILQYIIHIEEEVAYILLERYQLLPFYNNFYFTRRD